MTITREFRRNRQRVTDPDGVVVLVEVTHSSFSAPFRLANDTKAWVSRGVTYVGYPFQFTLPDSGEAPGGVACAAARAVSLVAG